MDNNTDSTLPNVSEEDIKEAKIAGIKQAVTESAAAQFKATDGIEQDDEDRGIVVDNGVLHIADWLEMRPEDLKKRLDGKDDAFTGTISREKVAGLLETERSGKNRTDIVKVLCDHLGIDTPYAVTGAGPAWTNPVDRDEVKPRG